ncbi:unnamed protein product [Cochlearia groenlandica]
MFSLMHGLWTYMFSKAEFHVLILGIDKAGKTDFLMIGLFLPSASILVVLISNAKIVFWDLGGQDRSIGDIFLDDDLGIDYYYYAQHLKMVSQYNHMKREIAAKEEKEMEKPKRKISRQKTDRKIRRKRTKREEPERKKIIRQITSLDDEELWLGFETEETDRILSGEIQPMTYISTFQSPEPAVPFVARGPLIAEEFVKAIPNSTYLPWNNCTTLHKILTVAKTKGCTSLVIGFTDRRENDHLSIINLLNGAVANFSLFDFIPSEEIPNRGDPAPKQFPQVHMKHFTSPSSVGTCRMIQALFPAVPPLPCRRNVVWFQNQSGHIFFRRHCLSNEEAYEGENENVSNKVMECGPRFTLKLTSVEKVDFDTGTFRFVCKTVSGSKAP